MSVANQRSTEPVSAEADTKSEIGQRRTVPDQIRTVVASPLFWPLTVCALGLGIIFWPLVRTLPQIWLSPDGYYSHGFLVPFIAAYILVCRWPKIKDIEVRTGWAAFALLLPLLVVLRAANNAEIFAVLSVGLVASTLLCAWFVAGWRWMAAISPSILYFFFALPVWTMAIDDYTNPLQIASTKTAFFLLRLAGRSGYQIDPTTLVLPSGYTLNVAVPCSGLKLMLAVTAFMTFFLLIARLRWWGNALMALMVLPLCLGINGLRIALIGLVGDLNGAEAAATFHDYSGYITLVICFLILFKTARWLGWKD